MAVVEGQKHHLKVVIFEYILSDVANPLMSQQSLATFPLPRRARKSDDTKVMKNIFKM